MDDSELARLEALLDRALDLPAAERTAFVHAAAGENETLRRAAEQALAEDDGAERELRAWVDELIREPGRADGEGIADDDLEPGSAPATAAPGDRFGAFRVLRSIGRGGMGEVFLAERADGEFGHQVAIKLLHAAARAAGLEARLRRERQILARLEHPHIARLLDGGVTAAGAPYLVLEYVAGMPLTDYCRDRAISLRQRLTLFLQVCDAVSHAHRHLVVHRDLKPGNILVDGEGQVKLLDFGISKLLDDEPTSGATQTLLRALTPQYASPEQMRGEPVTTATDVYGLGLVLSELLTGEPAQRVVTGSAAEIARLVLDEEPLAPSSAAARRDGAAPIVAAKLRGDLDAIVARALRKEPGERYSSVEALADDLRHYLTGLPVAARRGALGYRLAKFVRRHRVGLAATALVVLALVAGLGGVLWQANRAQRERARAVASEAKANAVNRFLVHDLLGAASPESGRGRDATVAAVLDDAERQVGAALAGQPELEQAVRGTLGETRLELGDLDAAGLQLERSLVLARDLYPAGDLELLRAETRSARLRLARGDYARAEADLAAAIAHAERTRGATVPSVELATARAVLGKTREKQGRLVEAETDLRRAVAEIPSGRAGAVLVRLDLLAMLAETLALTRRNTEAEATARQQVELGRHELGPEHPELARALAAWATALRRLGRPEEAERAARDALAIRAKVLGENHPDTLQVLHLLVAVLGDGRRFAEAEDFARRELAGLERTLGERHPRTAGALESLAIMVGAQGRKDEAAGFYSRALAIHREVLGADHPTMIRSLRNQAEFWLRRGDATRARTFAGELMATARAVAGREGVDAVVANDLAWFALTCPLSDLRDVALAHRLAERAVTATSRRWPDALDTMSLAEQRAGRLTEAVALEREAMALPEGLFSYGLEDRMMELLHRAGDDAGGERFLREMLARRQAAAPEPRRLGRTRALLGAELLRGGQAVAAERELRGAVEQLAANAQLDDWRLLLAEVDLAATLVAQHRCEEGETTLLALWKGLAGRPAIEPSDRRAVVDGLVHLYEACDRPADAATWRARRDETPSG